MLNCECRLSPSAELKPSSSQAQVVQASRVSQSKLLARRDMLRPSRRASIDNGEPAQSGSHERSTSRIAREREAQEAQLEREKEAMRAKRAASRQRREKEAAKWNPEFVQHNVAVSKLTNEHPKYDDAEERMMRRMDGW